MARTPNKASCHSDSPHPSHDSVLPRLRRAQGQLAGIEAMIQDQRYCPDILMQFRASIAALRSIEAMIFETHLKHCVQHALESTDKKAVEKKIQELTNLISKRF